MKVNCEGTGVVKLQELVPFQGKMKKLSDEMETMLIRSLMTEGLMAPFFIWVHDGKKYVLDGHSRLHALLRMSMMDPELLDREWPCVEIQAETEERARVALLQITSQYGKVTKAGLRHFTATLPNYTTAPVCHTFKPTRVAVRKQDVDHVILKIRVKKEVEEKVREILEECPGLEVL